MKTIIHRAATRGHANHGWLDSWHTFSFANYYEPTRVHFGALRVLNDDTVAAGMGFGKHPHDNMEIISIPLEGDLEHGDNMGNTTVIKQGDVQIMSAGTGVVHSEKNNSSDKPVKFLQIWVFPDQQNVQPHYDQKTFSNDEKQNKLVTVVSPVGSNDGGVKIHQDAWIYRSRLEKGKSIDIQPHSTHHGFYVFIIDGNITVENETLSRRDAIGISEVENINITANDNSDVLILEVPMFA